jgi:hypothetical protein
MLAARAEFAEKAYVRKIYAYSIEGSAALFLGYMVLQ